MINLWRWHPEVALRYLPVVGKINQDFGKKKIKILEVGSGWLGIAPYINREVIGLEEKLPGKSFSGLSLFCGSILNIPFDSDSFQAVVCVDVLEHLKKPDREKALTELLRVTKNNLYLAAPCSHESLKQDKKLNRLFSYPFLQQHLENKLPEKGEIMAGLQKAALKNHKKIKMSIYGNENLSLRFFLMKGFISQNFFINVFFRKVLLFFLPLSFLFNKPPFYRQIFSVKIKL